jgi:hypothetical protein
VDNLGRFLRLFGLIIQYIYMHNLKPEKATEVAQKFMCNSSTTTI